MSQAPDDKRVVPTWLQQVLKKDERLSKDLVVRAEKFLPLKTLRVHYKMLEFSCHGIPWFAFWLSFTWLFNQPQLVQMQVNILLGLFADILVVALLKAYFRRRRPSSNRDDALGQIGPDVYSFPSGHASRAVFVAGFFTILDPLPWFCWGPVLAWAACVCGSRIMMSRHNLLDVMAGILLGLINVVLLSCFWVDDGLARWLMSFLSDEKLDGGEYHV